jgi:hypothetical protein
LLLLFCHNIIVMIGLWGGREGGREGGEEGKGRGGIEWEGKGRGGEGREGREKFLKHIVQSF